jgi:hypothetical protein
LGGEKATQATPLFSRQDIGDEHLRFSFPFIQYDPQQKKGGTLRSPRATNHARL